MAADSTVNTIANRDRDTAAVSKVRKYYTTTPADTNIAMDGNADGGDRQTVADDTIHNTNIGDGHTTATDGTTTNATGNTQRW